MSKLANRPNVALDLANNLSKTFAELGLSPELLNSLTKAGFVNPFPIQEAVIPLALTGADIIGQAKTGTGKTLGFGLPLLNNVKRGSGKAVALVVVPTRELGIQVAEELNKLAGGPDLRVTAIYGGRPMEPQIAELNKGVDIVVGTPGRLLDLQRQKALDLSEVKYLVLDEADKMLGLGFSEELNQILQALPKKRQTLLFSATFPPELEQLIANLLHQPIEINLAKQDENLIEQHVYVVEQEHKNAALIQLIKTGNWQQVLVFASAKNTCNRLVLKLAKAGIQAAAFHGDLSQSARNKALEDFKAKKIRVLIATDVAARGIDIQQLPYVVNFELPRSANDYIHRIGRTGRAGQQGYAVAIITEEDEDHFRLIEKRMKKRLPREQIIGF